jgi:two-component system NtrC family sensor kinase
MRFSETIAFRLFLLIASVSALILATFTVVSIHLQRAESMDHVVLSARRISDVIARSTRYSMMLNHKEDVQSIVTSIGGQQGIEGIRIYNKQGVVAFATPLEDLHVTADLSAEACVTCHPTDKLQDAYPAGDQLTRIFTRTDGTRILGLITPIRNERACSDAACHAHPPEKTILGVLDVKMSLASVDTKLEESTTQLILLSIGAVLLVSLVSGGFIWMVVHRPVKQLTSAMRRAARGGFDQKIVVQSQNEIGELASQFNAMTTDLAAAREEITAWSSTLEAKVKQKSEELQRAHRHLLHVEKMASLGNLAASVAHELNNPLEGILTFARLLVKRILKSSLPADQIASYTGDLMLVADEAQRCGNIVKNLLLFARQRKEVFKETLLQPLVARCVMLMSHHAKVHSVEITVAIPDDVRLECNADEIEQVIVALMANAIEAMSGVSNHGGTLSIMAQNLGDDEVLIRLADTGIGMTEEIRAHIFEPFFTTKSNEKGVGLGLAVAYGIIQSHGGTIEVESSPGQGATFSIKLPRKQHAATGGQPVVS